MSSPWFIFNTFSLNELSNHRHWCISLAWATELGKAFTSDQKAVLDSVQRLRAQAKAAGNLKTTPQQEVKTETQNGTTVIVVQPANPQVVYVPQYNPQTVCAAPPPAQDNSGNVAAAAVIGFAVGIALGAAMNDSYGYYGWGAWGMHWHSSVVVVHGGAWRVPPGRYAYARPVAGYHPNYNVNAPRHNNVNVNVNNNINVNRQNVNTGARTPRPTTTSSALSRTGQATTSAVGTARSQPASNAYRGRTQTTSTGAASPSAEDAVVAMVDALTTNNEDKLVAIFGPAAREAMASGDAVADQRGRDLFIAAYNERCVLVDEEKTKTLHIGSEDWPFPIPLVKEAAGWRFDTPAGIEELRYRRIGRNELATIGACDAYVAAQKEYAQKGHDGKPRGIYAQKFASDSGKQNGLYWQVKLGEEDSPLGELAAEAAAEGYTRSSEKPMPFRGYYFRILTAEGPSPEGGAKSYLVKGEMRNGFALVAFPAEYGKGGVMTFIVDQSGIIYEKDLGEETAKLAGEMKAYNPDSTWRRTNSQEP